VVTGLAGCALRPAQPARPVTTGATRSPSTTPTTSAPGFSPAMRELSLATTPAEVNLDESVGPLPTSKERLLKERLIAGERVLQGLQDLGPDLWGEAAGGDRDGYGGYGLAGG